MAEQNVSALVTGATAGLGRAFCRQLASRCDVIIAVGRRTERLEALVQELEGRAEVHAVTADLGTVEGVTATVEALRQKGPVDYLVNNAGFSPWGAFINQSIESQLAMLSLHCEATVLLCRAALPFMRERGGGTIINVSSLGALVPSRGIVAYGATKAYLNYFSLALQEEVADIPVRIQALCPGYIHTEFHDGMAGEGFDKSRVPEALWMDAEEVVAHSLASLDSDKVIVVPGAVNLELARAAQSSLLEALT